MMNKIKSFFKTTGMGLLVTVPILAIIMGVAQLLYILPTWVAVTVYVLVMSFITGKIMGIGKNK